MKNNLSNILTIVLCVVLVVGAVCIGGVKGYKEEREELLLECMAMHSAAGVDLEESIEDCEESAEDFDERLDEKLMGRIAGVFGVEPIGTNVKALHAQLIREQAHVAESPDLLEQLGHQVEALLDDHIDTTLSLGKVFWTVVLLMTIFGKRGRRKGFTFGKLLAGFGLFNLWRKK